MTTMTDDDPCLECTCYDKLACASCWSAFAIIAGLEMADSEMLDESLWEEVCLES